MMKDDVVGVGQRKLLRSISHDHWIRRLQRGRWVGLLVLSWS